MKLNVTGVCAGPRNERCWRAIVDAADGWESNIRGASLEARFIDDPELLQFALSAPGRDTETANIDITWIAYPDQAEQLALHTLMALRDLEHAMRDQFEGAAAEPA